MPVGKMNTVTRSVGQVDVTTHPAYRRLFEREGFTWVDGTTFDAFLSAEGFKMVVFSEDPNAKRVSLDIAVIAPELKKAFAGTLTETVFTHFNESRALAGRFGITGMPAVALFRDSVYLGAVQGLKDWNEYCRQLSEIVVREKAPVRRVAFMQEKTVSHCSD
jgi:hupG protein